ncbi:acyl-CoA thioesterase [Desulfovibrio sp. OttesenSCG-928-O18]|nr:acyl-CoA thioesterase [Desulfovibrio sp. OttesenSCG-928-O18]
MTTTIPAAPCPETGGIWHPHRVSYGETDAMGVLYYAEYMHIFERARSSLIREKGVSYAEVEKRGTYLPVREAYCRYRAPARYDDLLFVRAWISNWGRASVTFSYELFAENKETLLATGMTQHACVNAQGRPGPAPAWLKELLL